MADKNSRLLLLAFFGVALFLTFNKHSRSGYFNYKSEIWADKAGYYVYLPATFIYGFDANEFPDSMDIKTGRGFELDLVHNKVVTKYTSGVAFLEAPFFLVAHLLAPNLGYEPDGFSPIYHKSIDVAGAFYLVLGLGLLSFFLRKRFTQKVAWLTTLSLFLATNLYYYGIDETGMSHIYSFALFSMSLFFIDRIKDKKSNTLKYSAKKEIISLGIILGLIILIRPTNIIFLTALLFLDAQNFGNVKDRVISYIRQKSIWWAVLVAFVVFVPQLFYWQYLSGQPIAYSYGEEGFNWFKPKLLLTWFSSDNGLFVYTPLYFLIVWGMIKCVLSKNWNMMIILSIFLFLSYVLSCWWKWNFGCSFGARSYVEYLALFSMSLARTFEKTLVSSTAQKCLLFCLMLLLVFLNLKMTYNFDSCYYGQGNWDWQWVKNLISR